MRNQSLADMTKFNDYSPLLGQKFQVASSNSDQIEVELIEAEALPSPGKETQNESFSLVFRAAKDSGLWQGITTLEHASLGSTDLFLVPVGEDEEGLYFQAVFN